LRLLLPTTYSLFPNYLFGLHYKVSLRELRTKNSKLRYPNCSGKTLFRFDRFLSRKRSLNRIHILKYKPSASLGIFFYKDFLGLTKARSCTWIRFFNLLDQKTISKYKNNVDPRGVEPPASSLQMKRSTGELRAHYSLLHKMNK
jgi:hypothetical protein